MCDPEPPRFRTQLHRIIKILESELEKLKTNEQLNFKPYQLNGNIF